MARDILKDKEKERTKPLKPYIPDKLEKEVVLKVENSQSTAEGGCRSRLYRYWQDEYRIYIGRQWETSFAPRTESGRRRNYNSQDNFIFATIQNMLSYITTSTPVGQFEPFARDDKTSSQKINDLIPHILDVNSFPKIWKKLVTQYLIYGPAIASVGWDNHMIGGSGPTKWVGEVNIEYIRKEDFFPDPAINDLEMNMQDCEYINVRLRKKIDYFRRVWPDKGKYVLQEEATGALNDTEINEGDDPNSAYLVCHWHRGLPYFVPKEWQDAYKMKAEALAAEGDTFGSKDCAEMAEGNMSGIHVAYYASGILLDYIPYMYDDGEYPFVMGVMYKDELQPYGLGEVRNLLIPQINHNKADEIELEAMTREGLGGAYYNRNSITPKQLDTIITNSAKAGAFLEVQDVQQIKERSGLRVPQSISIYKEHKQKVIDTVSQNTAIQQGMMPKSGTPGVVIEQLGARADTRMRGKIEVLEDFVCALFRKIVSRVIQFYTQERAYRILGNNQALIEAESFKVLQQIAMLPPETPVEMLIGPLMELIQYIRMQLSQPDRMGVISREDLVKEWEREVYVEDNGQVIKKVEKYVPEFDLKVKVVDERPVDRNYYTSIAMQLLGTALGIKSFWKTIDEGKFPPVEEILLELQQQQQMMMQQQQQAEAEAGAATALSSGKAEADKRNASAQSDRTRLAGQLITTLMQNRAQRESDKTKLQASSKK